MFAKFALDAAGRAMFYTNTVSNADFIAGQAYLMEAACVDTDTVAASDAYNGGFRYTSSGALRVYDATAGVPAGSNTNRGVMCTSDGQVCYTTDAISSDVAYYNGMAVDSAGRVFATLLTPAAWFRYGQGITSASDAVSQWADQSGNDRHLNQSTGTKQPSLQSDGSILFDGVDDSLLTDAFTLGQPCSVYALFKQVSWTAGDFIWSGQATGPLNLIQPATSSPQIRFRQGSSGLATVQQIPIDDYGIVVCVADGASSGIQVNTESFSTGNAGTAALDGFTLGSNAAGGGAFGNIQVEEIIIFPAAHDANTRLHTIRYLQRVGALWP